ncbi:uncharacterized protein smim29 isoform X2 [Thunnus maccoyii]|nr:uncharacterized protein smim29 isoform X2 [Thunnus maccoyii]
MLVDQNKQPFRVKLIHFSLTLERSEAIPVIGVQPPWHSLQALQDTLANCQKAKDDRDLIMESVSDDDHSGLESITDNAKTIPSVDYDNIIITVVPPNICVETPASVLTQASSINSLHPFDVSDPKKKKKMKGIQGFFSTLRWKFSCICVAEDDNDNEFLLISEGSDTTRKSHERRG